MATSIKNLSRVPQSVGVLVTDTKGNQKSAYVRLMPRSKKYVDLDASTVVDPRWLAHNQGVLLIKVSDDETSTAVAQATSATVVLSTAATTSASATAAPAQTNTNTGSTSVIASGSTVTTTTGTTTATPTVSTTQGGK